MRQLIIFLLVLAGFFADAQVNSNNTLYTGRNKWTGYHNISNTPLIISDNNEDTLRVFVRGDSILFRGTTRFVFEPPLSGGGGGSDSGTIDYLDFNANADTTYLFNGTVKSYNPLGLDFRSSSSTVVKQLMVGFQTQYIGQYLNPTTGAFLFPGSNSYVTFVYKKP